MSELYVEPEMAVGVNGATVYTEAGVADPAVVLYSKLIRGTDSATLLSIASQVEDIELLALITFYARDILEGNGERQIFYILFQQIYRRWPEKAVNLLSLVPEYGAWFDLYRMLDGRTSTAWEFEPVRMTNPLAEHAAEVYAQRLLDEYRTIQRDPEAHISLAAKWAPREGKRYHWFAKMLMKKSRTNYKEYRRMVSALSAHLDVLERKMCHDDSGASRWSDIKYEAVPSLALKKYRKAFEKVKPDNTDREAAHMNFMAYLTKLQAKETTAHGKLIYPHEFVKHLKNSAEPDPVLEAQWADLVASLRGRGVLSDTVVMADVSGSMYQPIHGTTKALDVSIGLSILLSELSTSVAQDGIMTFSAEPVWYDLSQYEGIWAKVKYLTSTDSGLNTNFQGAMNLLLNTLRTKKVPPGKEPKKLVVITDMGWDAAAGDCGDRWEADLSRLRRHFREEGDWGVPHIILWNVSTQFNDYHAQADTPGVSMISGWNSNLMKQFMDGVDIVQMLSDPRQAMRAVLYSDRYQPVIEALEL